MRTEQLRNAEIGIIMKLINDMAPSQQIEAAIKGLCAREYTDGLDAGREDQRSRSFNSTHGHDMGQ